MRRGAKWLSWKVVSYIDILIPTRSPTSITSSSGGSLAGYSILKRRNLEDGRISTPSKKASKATTNKPSPFRSLPGQWGVRCAAFACVYEGGKSVSSSGRLALINSDYLKGQNVVIKQDGGRGERVASKVVDCVFGAGMASLLGTTVGNQMIEDGRKMLRIESKRKITMGYAASRGVIFGAVAGGLEAGVGEIVEWLEGL